MATEEMKFWHSPTFLSPIDETFYEHAVKFPDEFPYEFDSFTPDYALNSPVESISSANEAESSDGEEFFATLTQVQDSRAIHVSHSIMDLPEMKKLSAAGSPQSIFGGSEVWSRPSFMSRKESPTGHSHFPSPPTTPCFADNNTLDLVYEVAGQVARLKMNSEATKYGQSNYAVNNLNKCSRGCLSPLQRPNLILSPVQPNLTLHRNRFIQQIYSSIAQHQQAARHQPFESRRINEFVRQEKLYQSNLEQQKEQIQQLERGIEHEILRVERSFNSPQPSQVPLHCRRPNQPPLVNCPASSLSFQGISNVKRESSGTGVFLPRGYGNPFPPRKKSGCPPVLSTEVLEAINVSSSNAKKNQVRAQLHGVLSSSKDPLNCEILLPQEWTY